MEGGTDQQWDLPGFRFHPTEEELLEFFLRNKAVNRQNLDITNAIGTLNLYRFNPWDLPEKAKVGEREWYFFVPRDRRRGNGGRPNRTTEKGFWKATGSDRQVRRVDDPERVIGLRRTLVFYQGRAPRGVRTDWVMNEYRLPDDAMAAAQEDVVLCKVYRKATPTKELGKRTAAMAALDKRDESVAYSKNKCSVVAPLAATGSSSPSEGEWVKCMEPVDATEMSSISSVGAVRPARESAPELELEVPNISFEYGMMEEPFLRSPWMECWSPYAQLLNS